MVLLVHPKGNRGEFIFKFHNWIQITRINLNEVNTVNSAQFSFFSNRAIVSRTIVR